MNSEIFFLRDLVNPLLGLLVDAGAGLPVLGALGLLISRRGHATFCLWATRHCFRFALLICVIGLLYYPLSCYLVLASADIGSRWLGLFVSRPGMPWFSAWGAWLLGCFFLFFAEQGLLRLKVSDSSDQLTFTEIRGVFWVAMLASICLFASFFLINWPFAGMPAELSFHRVLVAIARDAFRHWFIAFSTAGAFGLIYISLAFHLKAALTIKQENAIRWCAIWAFAASLPSALLNLGLLLGVLLRGNAAVFSIPGAYGQVFAIICNLLALLCFFWCFWKKRAGFFAWLGFALLCLKTYSRLIISIFS